MSSRLAGRYAASYNTNPAREAVPVWEQQWVLPTPTSRIKVLKWVKASNGKSRTFPETEDARYIYASSSNVAQGESSRDVNQNEAGVVSVEQQQQQQGQDKTGQDAEIHTVGAATSTEAAQVQPAVVDEDAMEQQQRADATGGNANEADETQGSHLFDETMKPADTDDNDVEMNEGDKILEDGEQSKPVTEPPTAAETPVAQESSPPQPSMPTQQSAQEEEGDEEEEEEEEVQEQDKHSTIRIGGPLADTSSTAVEDAAPQPQVSSELHPQPEGTVLEQPAGGNSDELVPEQEPSAPLAAPDQDTIAGGAIVETTTRDDPDVKGLGHDIEAVVHEQPDSVEQVKVVVDE
ncbi:unnamed protein product [Sympodiomycopsis kandeliae]